MSGNVLFSEVLPSAPTHGGRWISWSHTGESACGKQSLAHKSFVLQASEPASGGGISERGGVPENGAQRAENSTLGVDGGREGGRKEKGGGGVSEWERGRGLIHGGQEGSLVGGGGVLPWSKVKLVMSAMTHSSQHALLTSRIPDSSLHLLPSLSSSPLLPSSSGAALL